jgi:hypothetical protein
MVVGVFVLEVLYSLLIVFLSMHSYGERRETKGKLVGTNGTVLILYSRHTGIVQVQVRGPKTEYLVDLFFIWLPHGSKDGHSLRLANVVSHVFEYFVLSIIKKRVCYCRYSCK